MGDAQQSLDYQATRLGPGHVRYSVGVILAPPSVRIGNTYAGTKIPGVARTCDLEYLYGVWLWGPERCGARGPEVQFVGRYNKRPGLQRNHVRVQGFQGCYRLFSDVFVDVPERINQELERFQTGQPVLAYRFRYCSCGVLQTRNVLDFLHDSLDGRRFYGRRFYGGDVDGWLLDLHQPVAFHGVGVGCRRLQSAWVCKEVQSIDGVGLKHASEQRCHQPQHQGDGEEEGPGDRDEHHRKEECRQ